MNKQTLRNANVSQYDKNKSIKDAIVKNINSDNIDGSRRLLIGKTNPL